MTCHAQIYTKGREARRAEIRSITMKYARTARDLDNILRCVSFPDRPIVAAAIADPLNPDVTKMVCHALYRRMVYCKSQGDRMRAAYLCAREYFGCECDTYRRQRAAQRPGPHHLFDNVISIGIR